MTEIHLLDASAVLALLQEEPGAERVEAVLAGARIGIVNLAEVYSKLAEAGLTTEEATTSVGLLGLAVEPMDEAQALEVGRLRPLTRKQGLSLGDRSCLALAAQLDAVAVTTERSWSQVGVCKVLVVR